MNEPERPPEERKSRVARSRPVLYVCIVLVVAGLVYIFERGFWGGLALTALAAAAFAGWRRRVKSGRTR